jgi:hypothetical protein
MILKPGLATLVTVFVTVLVSSPVTVFIANYQSDRNHERERAAKQVEFDRQQQASEAKYKRDLAAQQAEFERRKREKDDHEQKQAIRAFDSVDAELKRRLSESDIGPVFKQGKDKILPGDDSSRGLTNTRWVSAGLNRLNNLKNGGEGYLPGTTDEYMKAPFAQLVLAACAHLQAAKKMDDREQKELMNQVNDSLQRLQSHSDWLRNGRNVPVTQELIDAYAFLATVPSELQEYKSRPAK